MTGETVFNQQDRVANLCILTLNGTQELGEKINRHLVSWAQKSGRAGGQLPGGVGVPPFLLR